MAGSHGGRWGIRSARVRYGTLSEGKGEARREHEKRARSKKEQEGRERQKIQMNN